MSIDVCAGVEMSKLGSVEVLFICLCEQQQYIGCNSRRLLITIRLSHTLIFPLSFLLFLLMLIKQTGTCDGKDQLQGEGQKNSKMKKASSRVELSGVKSER